MSKKSFLRWTQEYEPVRNAIFGGLLDGMIRMSELLQTRKNMPLEARLIGALLRGTSEANPLLHTTHQELAAEIDSAREVVSRVLQRYQKKGWLEMGRGWVRIIRRSELESHVCD